VLTQSLNKLINRINFVSDPPKVVRSRSNLSATRWVVNTFKAFVPSEWPRAATPTKTSGIYEGKNDSATIDRGGLYGPVQLASVNVAMVTAGNCSKIVHRSLGNRHY